MALNKFKKILVEDNDNENEYYNEDDTENSTNKSGKMILLEPRAFSESQQIADHLKKRNTVVVNMKRVTPDQAKRIIDFLSGTVYAIGGDLQKIGGGIFLCTPKNVNVEGAISDDEDKAKKNKENNYEILKKTILEASKEYVADNRYGNVESSITAQYLLDNHYITSGLTDPKTGKNIDLNSVIITITYQNKKYIYEIKQEDWKLEDGNYCCQ